jgi:GntR family transcriptional regulator/MocR family aminotransferase
MPALFQLERNLRHSTLQQQIRVQLVDAILGGYIPLDEPLPSSRGLAKSLKVARNTIVLVYDELAADGYLISKERSGYYIDPQFVSKKISTTKSKLDNKTGNSTNSTALTAHQRSFSWQDKIKADVNTPKNPSIAHTWQKHPFPFVYAQMDSTLFPIDNWRKCWRDAVSVQAIKDWTGDSYDSDDPLLIEQIQKRILPNRGIHANTDEILITVGSQQAIYLIAQLLLNSQSNFGMEDPGYISAAHVAKLFGATITPLAVNHSGLVINEQLNDCDLIYTTPSYQCPTTVTMPLAQRHQLLKKADKQDLLIIEDDYEMEINYDSNPVPALKSLDTNGRVIYIGSLSKTLAPGLRVGFMVGPKELIKAAQKLRQLMLKHPPLNNQRTVALFLAQGYHDALLRKLVRTFQERRSVMANALIKYIPQCHFFNSGGSSFWCELPKEINTQKLKESALDAGILIITGDSYFYDKSKQNNYLKLGFSAIQSTAIEAGIKGLADLILIQNKANQTA